MVETEAPKIDGIAVVLAGGKSRRMGRDKAFLEIDGVPMIRGIVSALARRFSEVWVSGSNSPPYRNLGVRIIEDKRSGRGPLMGILSALEVAQKEMTFFQACDIPVLDSPLFYEMLARFESGKDAVMARLLGERPVPTLAFYRRSVVLPVVASLVESDRLAARGIAERCDVAYVDIMDVEKVPNLNRPEAFNAFLRQRNQR